MIQILALVLPICNSGSNRPYKQRRKTAFDQVLFYYFSLYFLTGSLDSGEDVIDLLLLGFSIIS